MNASSTIIITFSETETGKVCSSSRVPLSDLNTLISTCSGYSLGHRSDTCENTRNYTKFTVSTNQQQHTNEAEKKRLPARTNGHIVFDTDFSLSNNRKTESSLLDKVYISMAAIYSI